MRAAMSAARDTPTVRARGTFLLEHQASGREQRRARAPRRDRARVCAYDACVLAIGRAAGRARRPGAASRARIVRARVLRGDTWTAGPQIHVGARAMGCRAGRRRFYAREA